MYFENHLMYSKKEKKTKEYSCRKQVPETTYEDKKLQEDYIYMKTQLMDKKNIKVNK